MIEFVSIIIIVFGVLQIILFFKVWGMTNNVSAIKSKLERSDLYMEARKAYVLSDLVKAKTLLDESYAEGIIMIKEKYPNEHELGFQNLYGTESQALVDKYAKVYEKMGITMPDLSKFNKISTIPV